MIRPTREHEIDRLQAIERSAGTRFLDFPALAWIASEPPFPPERHRRLIAAGGSWVATEPRDEPIGFLCAEATGDDLHIREVSVHRAHQGKGHGASLVRHAIDAARDRRFRRVTLTTFRAVEWNAPFYARLGFMTLEGDRLDDRLADILEVEARHGFAPGTRCAMALIPA